MANTWFVKSIKDGKVFGSHTQKILQQYVQQGKIVRSEYRTPNDNKT